MDEAKLQEILDDASERLSLGRYSNADAAVHDLVAEVRRLTAALAAVTAERDAALEECDTLRRGRDHGDGVIDDVREILGAAEDESAVAAARRIADAYAAYGREDVRLRDALDAGDEETAADAARRVVRERDEARAALAVHQSATDAAVDGVRTMLPAALEIARREGAEGMLARCRTAARAAFDAHPLTLDRYHEPGCICDAIGRGSCSECDRGEAVIAALDALPIDDRGAR